MHGAEQQQQLLHTHINVLAAVHPELRAAHERVDNLYQMSGADSGTHHIHYPNML